MKFKSTDDQEVIVYRDPGEGSYFLYGGRLVKVGEIIDVHFDDVVESVFHSDVSAGFYIPFDQAAIDWTCKHMDVAC